MKKFKKILMISFMLLAFQQVRCSDDHNEWPTESTEQYTYKKIITVVSPSSVTFKELEIVPLYDHIFDTGKTRIQTSMKKLDNGFIEVTNEIWTTTDYSYFNRKNTAIAALLAAHISDLIGYTYSASHAVQIGLENGCSSVYNFFTLGDTYNSVRYGGAYSQSVQSALYVIRKPLMKTALLTCIFYQYAKYQERQKRAERFNLEDEGSMDDIEDASNWEFLRQSMIYAGIPVVLDYGLSQATLLHNLYSYGIELNTQKLTTAATEIAVFSFIVSMIDSYLNSKIAAEKKAKQELAKQKETLVSDFVVIEEPNLSATDAVESNDEQQNKQNLEADQDEESSDKK